MKLTELKCLNSHSLSFFFGVGEAMCTNLSFVMLESRLSYVNVHKM